MNLGQLESCYEQVTHHNVRKSQGRWQSCVPYPAALIARLPPTFNAGRVTPTHPETALGIRAARQITRGCRASHRAKAGQRPHNSYLSHARTSCSQVLYLVWTRRADRIGPAKLGRAKTAGEASLSRFATISTTRCGPNVDPHPDPAVTCGSLECIQLRCLIRAEQGRYAHLSQQSTRLSPKVNGIRIPIWPDCCGKFLAIAASAAVLHSLLMTQRYPP